MGIFMGVALLAHEAGYIFMVDDPLFTLELFAYPAVPIPQNSSYISSANSVFSRHV